jgi:putative two-component system response regulator
MSGEGKVEKIILAVDDTSEALVNINEILCDDYDVRLAKSAAAGMTLLRTEKVDLILLDIDMPVLSGFDFQEFLRWKPDIKEIPVIFVTALNDPTVKKRVEESGAADFILKPFTPEQIKNKIRRIFDAKRIPSV